MEFVPGLASVDGYDTILVAVDRLTKFAVFLPTTKTAAAEGVTT